MLAMSLPGSGGADRHQFLTRSQSQVDALPATADGMVLRIAQCSMNSMQQTGRHNDIGGKAAVRRTRRRHCGYQAVDMQFKTPRRRSVA